MHAKVGEHIVVDARHIGTPERRGEVVEVLGQGAEVHYRVRWDDGHDSIFFPSTDAHVVESRSGNRR